MFVVAVVLFGLFFYNVLCDRLDSDPALCDEEKKEKMYGPNIAWKPQSHSSRVMSSPHGIAIFLWTLMACSILLKQKVEVGGMEVQKCEVRMMRLTSKRTCDALVVRAASHHTLFVMWVTFACSGLSLAVLQSDRLEVSYLGAVLSPVNHKALCHG